MKAPLMWNVYVGDLNSQKIETYNIFTHGRFYEKLCKLAKDLRRQLKNGEKTVTVDMWEHGKGLYTKEVPVKDYFLNEVRSELMYYFWSKCEWEVMITDWPSNKAEYKTDVYYQVRLNWGAFCNYLMDNLANIIPSNQPKKGETVNEKKL